MINTYVYASREGTRSLRPRMCYYHSLIPGNDNACDCYVFFIHRLPLEDGHRVNIQNKSTETCHTTHHSHQIKGLYG